MSTPADRLLAAADLLDKRAGEAAPDWELDDDNHLGVVSIRTPYMVGPDLWLAAKARDGERYSFTGPNDATTAYIATMHPEVGKAVAKVLRAYAEGARELEKILTSIPVGPGRSAMLDLADLVLAGQS